MNTRTLLIIALLLAHVRHAQAAGPGSPDSLWQVWMDLARPDTVRLQALDQHIWNAVLFTFPDSAFKLAGMMYDTAAQRNMKTDMASARNMQAIVKAMQGDHAGAVGYYQQSLVLSREAGNVRAEMGALTNIGGSYYDMGQPYNALGFYTEALDLAQSSNDSSAMMQVLHSMALANAKMDYLQKSDSLAQRSLAIAEELKDQRGVLSALMALGGNLVKTGRTDEALPIYQRAAVLADATGDKRQGVEVLFGLADIHAARGEMEQAIALDRKALSVAMKLGEKFVIGQAYGRLYEVYKLAHRPAEALEMYEHYVELHDQVLNDENKAALVRQKAQFDFDLKTTALRAEMDKQEAVATQEIQQQKTARNGILAGALLLLAGGGAWMYSDRKRRKERFHKEKAELETKVLRTQLNPHFIFNALNSINALVQRNDPEGASTYLAKFGRVMRGVLENSRHAEVALHDDLETLRGYIELERQRTKGKFDCTITVDPAINAAQVMVPPLMVQPLVENAIWHGLANKDGHGHILLDVKQQGGQLIWSIEDNGVGRNAAINAQDPAKAGGMAAKKTSLGTVITRGRLKLLQQQFGGSAGLRYEDLPQGTRAVVYMPLIAA